MENRSFIWTIKSLIADRERLSKEIDALDKAIEALTSVLSDDDKASFDSNLLQDDVTKEYKIEKKNAYEDYEIEIPNDYNNDLAPIEMLILALYELKGATAIDAAVHISKKGSELGHDYLLRRFTELGSALGRAGKLQFKKIGKRYKYFIPSDIVEKYESDHLPW